MATFAFLPRPLTFMRKRFTRWFESRLPFSDNVTLSQHNVYILPTRSGLMLALTLLLLLVASINYQLNLGYLLTFLLAGTALVGMHVGHATLRGLALNLAAPSAHYAGASTTFAIKLTNTRRSVRYAIGLSVLNTNESESPQKNLRHWVWSDVPAQGSSVLQVAFTPPRRGLHRLPTLTAETHFPLGTFRIWTIWRPAAQVMVYPSPEIAPPPLPPGEPRSQGSGAAMQTQSSGEFDGVRAYRRGDPLKNVLWKKAAKADAQGNGLVVRDTQQAQRHELWLDFRQAGPLGTEAKLSRLCAWVLQADKQNLDYGLRLPALEIKPSSGPVHQRQCLEALATC
ncbi:membrane protein [Polaromonas sp.]|nr:membrane protein [Polaromonas sp.]